MNSNNLSLNKSVKIFIAGHRGMVGTAIWQRLAGCGYDNLVGKSSTELNLRDQKEVDSFFSKEKPTVVIDAAAKVGGILANNSHPYPFLMENLQIQNNLIESSLKYNVAKFIFLGSSCIYPKLASQPIKEDYLLTGSLEPTNEWYALAKIAGVKACEAARKQYHKDYISLMPTNLYGPNDNFDLTTSHVLPAMIRKFHEAKVSGSPNVHLWGSGKPRREFMHVSDLAAAINFILENKPKYSLYNVGTGYDISINELAHLIKDLVQYEGQIKWDASKPDGTPRKLLDVSKINQEGWKAEVNLESGVKDTYEWYLNNRSKIRENIYT